MKELYLLAQSLDNQSSDVIVKFNVNVKPDDQVLLADGDLSEEDRSGVVSNIYKVSGKKQNLGQEVSIRSRGEEFVIEAIPDEKDEINRLAPVVIYGKLDRESLTEDIDDWTKRISERIKEEVKSKLDRTLSQEAIETIKKGLQNVLEKKKDIRVFFLLFILIFFSLLLFLQTLK